MEKHVNVVGVLHIGMGALWILGAIVILGVAFLAVGGTVGPGVLSGDQDALAVLTAIGVGLGIFLFGMAAFMALLSVPGIVGGLGVLRLKPWARYLVLVLAVLALFNVPIGTAVGVYSIWVLVQDETAELFAAESS
jgi:hypothetical protein